MGRFAIKAGTEMPMTEVGALCRRIHDDKAAQVREEIQERELSKIPLDGLENLGDYDGEDWLEGLSVSFRYVKKEELDMALATWTDALLAIDDGDGLLEKAKLDAKASAAAAGFVAIAVSELTGLRGLDGPIEIKANGIGRLTDEDVETLSDAGLVTLLFNIGCYSQRLDDEKKALWWSAQPPT